MSHLILDSCTGCTACTRICPVAAIPSVPRGEKHHILAHRCIDCGACGRVCAFDSIQDEKGTPCILLKRSEWFHPQVVIADCVACNICIQACPADCLTAGEPQGKPPKAYPILAQPKKCIGCHLCEIACPVGAIIPEAVAVKA